MKKRVLIVDDAYFMRNLIKKVLKEANYEVVGEAKNGTEGIDLYFKLKPDFVTMDISMPDMSGIEVTKQILSQDPCAKIIAVTGNNKDEIKTQMMEAGAKSYLKKPFQPAFLLTKVESLFSEQVDTPFVPAEEEATTTAVSETDELEDDFFARNIELPNKPDESKTREIVIENSEEQIDFLGEQSPEEKEKYALKEEEVLEEELSGTENHQANSIEDEIEIITSNGSANAENDSEQVYIELSSPESRQKNHSETKREEDEIRPEPESFLPPTQTVTVESSSEETSASYEESNSYMTIRPPRRKILTPLDQQENEELIEPVIIDSDKGQMITSQKKGFRSIIANLFSKKP